MKHGLVVNIETTNGERTTYKFVHYVGLIKDGTIFYIQQFPKDKLKEIEIPKENIKSWSARNAYNFSK